MKEPSAVFEIIHSITEQSGSHLSVVEMRRIVGVSLSGYYAWVHAAPVREEQEAQDRKDFDIGSVSAARVFQRRKGHLYGTAA